jgi:hypothetical protein
MLKHYVEFLYPGILFSDTSEDEVETRDIHKLEIPEYSFGFRFFDREQTILDGEVLTGKSKNYSNWYYYGKVMTIDDVKEQEPDQRILISNMENNDYKRIVRTKFGQSIPVQDEDVVIGE